MKTPFPVTNQFFGIRNKHNPGHTHNDAIMYCLSSDSNKVMYKIAGQSYNFDGGHVYFCDRTNWDFMPVSKPIVKLTIALYNKKEATS